MEIGDLELANSSTQIVKCRPISASKISSTLSAASFIDSRWIPVQARLAYSVLHGRRYF